MGLTHIAAIKKMEWFHDKRGVDTMTIAAASISQTQCLVRQNRYCQANIACNRCQGEAGYYSTAGRTAIDLDLARPVLLQVTVSVHYCDRCRHYMRAQPPFLR